MSETAEQLTYVVPGMSCEPCRTGITAELKNLAGVAAAEVDLDAKRVRVTGAGLDDTAVRAPIGMAGYDVARAV